MPCYFHHLQHNVYKNVIPLITKLVIFVIEPYLIEVLYLFFHGDAIVPYFYTWLAITWKMKYHWWFMLILLQQAKCIASFICIGSYVVDLSSRPYRYSIMGCSSTPCWVCRQEHFALHPYAFTKYTEVISPCYFEALSSGYVPNWKSLILF